MKRLFAGPFVGEFGHELFCWQGKIRIMSKEYDETTVVCMPGHEHLYSDFADKIITWKPEKYIPDCSFNSAQMKGYPKPDYECTYIPPNTQLIQLYDPHQEFVPLANEEVKEYDFVFSARDTNKHNTGYRNWNHSNWNELANRLNVDGYKIASIGRSDMSYYVNGTDNKMDITLKELSFVMAKSKCIVGGSSGPMHYATLCKTKQIVWSGDNIEINRKRYEDWWNPFNTPITFIPNQNWNPTVDEVYNSCIEMVRE